MIGTLKKLHKRRFDEAMFYGYVKALQFNLPTITKQKAIMNFRSRYKISEEEIPFNTMITTFNRIEAEVLEAEKNENTGN